ncbi:MAG: hypothetical protein DRP96_00190 [Candidatus Neomarinimicrobiota bacterium]|nr:MAG: hypothetical protein DRP96_00190 [Candidatus Neomarinimicrobiota bacterium]
MTFRSTSTFFHILNIFLISAGLILLFSAELFANPPLTGFVSDPNGTAIPFVSVYNKTNNNWLIGDSNGKIIFTNRYSPGDTLEFQRIGFQKVIIILPEYGDKINITMPFAPIQTDAVNILGQRYSRTTEKKFTEITILPELGVVESQQILASIPGTYIKSYGGPAGITTLSLDGAPSSHTSISYAGFDLTSAQNGQMDISQLPASIVSTISYSPNLDENQMEIGNAEGSIAIQPEMTGSGFTTSFGSYGHWSFSGNIASQSKRTRLNISSGKRHDNADYKATNPVNNRTTKRENNSFDQEFVSSTVTTLFSSNLFWKTMLMTSSQKRGVAGLIWSPTLNARRKDRLSILGTKLGWINPFGPGYLQFLGKKSFERYINPQSAIDTDHTLYTYQLIIKQTGNIRPNIRLHLYSDMKYDLMHSSETISHDRLSYQTKAAAVYFPSKRLSIVPMIAYNFSPDLYSKIDKDLQLRWHIPGNYGKFYVTAGRFFHYPTFNDLYWEPGGNPNLKPEHTDKISGGFELIEIAGITLKANLFYKKSKNLILWTPVQSYWQPKNIEKAIRKGYKITTNWHCPICPIHFDAMYNYVVSENLTPGDYYKKPLRYAPKETGALAISWVPGHCYFSLQMAHVGRRVAMYSWPEDLILDSYTIYSFNTSYRLNTGIGRFILAMAVNNLSDKKYVTLYGYPEPPRSLRLTLNYEMKNNVKRKRRIP